MWNNFEIGTRQSEEESLFHRPMKRTVFPKTWKRKKKEECTILGPEIPPLPFCATLFSESFALERVYTASATRCFLLSGC